MTEFHVAFQPEGKRVLAEAGTTLLANALKAGVDLTSICSGKGNCGKCKVIVDDKLSINTLTSTEMQMLSADEIGKGTRLACFTKVMGDVTVKIPETSRTGKQRLQIEGIETHVTPAPTVKKTYLEIPPPTLEDPRSDSDRIIEALKTKGGSANLTVSFDLVRILSQKMRDCEWNCTLVTWGDEIIDVEPDNTCDRLYGYAVDIGTTKLAGYLIDLRLGNVLGASSLMNPQIPFGEDVIARLNHPDQAALQRAVAEGLNSILGTILDKTGVRADDVYEMTTVGNTVMHHIFFGIDPIHLGRSPYPPVVRNAVTVNAKECGIKINPKGKIFFLPNIAGFVGADTVGVILSTEIYKKDQISVAIDIGTNTEIVLGNKDKLIAVSCASGPAFEGAHVRFGMRAASGAIEKIEIDADTLNARCKTIDDEPPIGICGSAMIDLVAEMLKTGIIDVMGIMKRDIKNPRIRERDDVMEYVVVNASESGTKEDITFSQKDVNQIILAKAAIYTGFKLLFKHYNIHKEDVHELLVAGAFGSHINKVTARMIGIIPEMDLNKIVVVGNAAGTGARMCLVSDATKRISETISRNVRYLELGVDEDFQKVFLNANTIPYADLEEFPEMCTILKKTGNYPEVPPPMF